MAVELTAVYESQPNGSVVAYIAELPAVTTGGRNLEEARSRLAEQLRLFLEQERADALTRIGAGARVESLRVEIGSHRDTRAEVDTNLETRVEIDVRPRTPRVDHESADLIEFLLNEGVIAVPPALSSDEDFEPVRIEGRPISEEIIEARR